MGHKRKDTVSDKKVEWARHFRPFEKRLVNKNERRVAKELIEKEKNEN